MDRRNIIIAIDGPAGSGKTTSAKIVADKLGYVYIDTGAMYRAVTLAWLRLHEAFHEDVLHKILNSIRIELEPSADGQRTLLNGEDVSREIRTPEVTNNVSPVSAVGIVRDKLVAMQREMGENGGVVMDGRDIGTVVFPNAELKIFLVATIDERARRRALEMKQNNMPVSEDDLKQQIAERDEFDSSRKNSPLRKADDAVEIDTSGLTIEQQTEKILLLARQILEK